MMPAPNDLTPEEQAEFSRMGAPDPGQGKEPLAEENTEGQQQEPAQQEPAAQEGQHADRRPNGQFMSAEERAAAEGQQQQQPDGQQQEPEGQQQQEPQMVPLAALHEARQRAANAQRMAQTLSARMNAFLSSRQEQQQGQQEQLPDLAVDPVGYITALEQRVARFENARNEENQFRQVDMALEQDEAIFSLSVPDYDKASDHYVQSRSRELLQFYPPHDAMRMMTQEARQIAQEAWQRGMSPAQMIYGLAQARGYVPGQQQEQGQQQGQQQGRQPTAQDKVRAVNLGQQASRSLSGGAGAGRTGALNAEAILAMSDDEFAQYLDMDKKGVNERFAAIGG